MIVRSVGVGRVWACMLLMAGADILGCDKGINGIPKKKKEKRLKKLIFSFHVK